jgi:hypothetical protein
MKEPKIDWEAPPPKGCVFIDICEGVEGPSVSIGDNDTGVRVAGPKPWGGGTTSRRFVAEVRQLRAALEGYEE